MSATIHYRKTSTVDPYLKCVGAPSSFIQTLERAFGHFPCELSETSISTLKGMSAMTDNQAYEEIIDLIEKFGSIELYASY